MKLKNNIDLPFITCNLSDVVDLKLKGGWRSKIFSNCFFRLWINAEQLFQYEIAVSIKRAAR
jgi:hypothetical protein